MLHDSQIKMLTEHSILPLKYEAVSRVHMGCLTVLGEVGSDTPQTRD
jgi:hypothetical protein